MLCFSSLPASLLIPALRGLSQNLTSSVESSLKSTSFKIQIALVHNLEPRSVPVHLNRVHLLQPEINEMSLTYVLIA
jgi:hypothetical protein